MLLLLVFGLMAALLGYMELQHEVEKIAPRTALITNHFTAEVRACDTHGSGDWSCREVDIEPRSRVFALIPFWPARDYLGDKLHLSEPWTDETPFTDTQLFSDMITNGAIGVVMLVLGIYIMRIKDDGE